MNGKNYAKGCPGAVWTDGNPAEVYCEGQIETDGAKYPWWKKCCSWDGSKCQPKGD